MNKSKNRLGLPVVTLFLLALLGIPRVIAHDLNWVEPGGLSNMLLVFIPPLIWLGVVVKKTTKPFKPLLLIGIFYGILLGFTHQLLWTSVFDSSPTLGSTLSDVSVSTNALITRMFGFISSLLTGTVVGLIVGLVGSFINSIRGVSTRKT
ncbi:hypothetical protein ACJROX_08305 [Pseudalkalibacillus sp. A8]|uniref:hypothetical protein n=1 Tax=Pseudalkalibacillus sp. A8 TaxID=3382641 RepID=UPI0038B5A3F8